jgi:hypothetical protein
MSDKDAQHKKLCDELHELYLNKNSDYGDSVHKTFEAFGLMSYAIRIADKYNRLETLVKRDCKTKVKDESIRDTLMDLAGYALLAVQDLDNSTERS